MNSELALRDLDTGEEMVFRVVFPSEANADQHRISVLAPLVSPTRLDEIRRHQVEMPPIGLSSSEIRRRVAAGLSIRYQTPRAVEKYIEAHGLYHAM